MEIGYLLFSFRDIDSGGGKIFIRKVMVYKNKWLEIEWNFTENSDNLVVEITWH